MAKKQSLIELVNSKPDKRAMRNWFDKLDDDTKAELNERKEAWKAGIIIRPITSVCEAIHERFPQVTVKRNEIGRWLNG